MNVPSLEIEAALLNNSSDSDWNIIEIRPIVSQIRRLTVFDCAGPNDFNWG
jgi:hypothetical protein